MAHFNIYLPGKQTSDPQDLVDVGLSDLTENQSMTHIEGPDHKGGMLVSWSNCFDWEKGWIWKPAKPFDELEAGRYWYGLKDDSPPKPKELQRHYPHTGSLMTLGDGNTWIMPRAQELPAELKMADDGTLKFEVQRKFHEFYIQSEDWFKKIANQKEATKYTYDDIAWFVMQAIKLNYRFTNEIITEIGIFTKANLEQSILEICGLTNG